MIRVKKNPPQDKKLANASNRRATEIYGLDDGGLELVLITLRYTSMPWNNVLMVFLPQE